MNRRDWTIPMNRRAGSERRKHPRFVMPSMYTSVAVRPLDSERFLWTGHAYDLSEGGMRFELDQPIAPGTRVAIRIQLPGSASLRAADRRPIYVFANVVWVEQDDLDQAGPVRMACVFSRFVQPGDQERLLARLNSGRYSAAA
ncbi:MAG: PilZ domain-containing protein [Phycisphaerales bacterium]|nr:PilZ domain-containing protein [Phycisphaerales bacterium]